jgi:hypothetical protein
MSKDRKNRVALFTALLLGAVVTFVGCETKGPAQRAGESFDKGIQDAKDAIRPPGTAEKVGRSVDKVLTP